MKLPGLRECWGRVLAGCSHLRPKLFNHVDPTLGFRPAWESESGPGYIIFLTLKLAACLYTWSSIIYTWISHTYLEYPAYLTNWGINLFCTAITWDSVLNLWSYFAPATNSRNAFLLSLCFTTMVYSLALFITIFYWAFVYVGQDLTYDSFFKHASQALLTVLDQLYSSRPWEPGHWWFAPIIPLIYLIFTLIYWGAGGTNEEGKTYLYLTLDYQNSPGGSVATIIGALFLIICIHLALAVVTWARNSVIMFLSEPRNSSGLQLPMPQEDSRV